MFLFIADWHALSTNYEDTGEIAANLNKRAQKVTVETLEAIKAAMKFA